MADNSGSFNLSDPSTFAVRKGGLPGNYSYQVSVSFQTRGGSTGVQYMTVRSNDLLTEEQITNTALVYARGKARSSVIGDITDISVTGASRSAALGSL